MSWGLSISATPKADFAAAVDAAEASGQDASLPGVVEQQAAARAALKALAEHVKRPLVTASAGGHALQADEGPTSSDSVSVNVWGAEV